MALVLKTGNRLVMFILILLTGPLIAYFAGFVSTDRDWRTASRESVGIAPDPLVEKGPIIQVYAARAFSWRGAFAVHTWISTKRTEAAEYVTYEVVGWGVHHGRNAIVTRNGAPDRRWYGAEPSLIKELRGAKVEDMIDRLENAVSEYPYQDIYRTWPGPNSNTFTAFMARSIPELQLDLPPTAIGKDYLGDKLLDASPSGTGWQVSLFGLGGVILAREEGLEINLLGLSFGLDPLDLAIKIPGLGRFSASGP